jgi:DNA repair exonuclease SbcCD ATPase subunit
VSALQRSGVSFTDAQKEQAEALFETGRAAEAQAIILAAVEKQVGGQAKAARDAAGGMKDMEVAASRLQEEFGKLLLTIGDAGAAGAVTTFLDKLTGGAQAWQGAINNINLLMEAQGRLDKKHEESASSLEQNLNALNDWLKIINPIHGVAHELGRLEGAAQGARNGNEALAREMQQVIQEQEAAKAAADANAKALQAESEAAAEDAAAQADLARKLEAANQARRDVASELIDITEQAAKDTQETWDDYFKDEQKLWDDHAEATNKIQADSAREKLENEKQLAKDLANVDRDLAKDLAKLDKDFAKDKAKLKADTDKQISRKEEDAARQEKQRQSARRIDAMGDERLFQFELRQLAAEGQGNAIKDALERREIERQIEAEKITEQQQSEDENRRIEIERIREDARERLSEMESEAAERRQELEDQAAERRAQLEEAAAEEEARRQEELAQALADEEANYQERLQALRDARDEKLAQIEETKNEAIAKLTEELAQSKDLTRQQMEELKSVAEELGPDVGAAFAEGLNAGFARNLRINQMLDDVGRETGGPRINPAHPGSGSNIGGPRRPPPRRTTSLGTPFAGFQHGVEDFIVPPGFPNDSFAIGVSSGERVNVQPQGQGSNITVNVNGPGGAELAAIIRRKVEEGVQEYHDTVIVPWSRGQ